MINTGVYVRIPNQEENSTTNQVMGETAKIGEAITMIYKMVNENVFYNKILIYILG